MAYAPDYPTANPSLLDTIPGARDAYNYVVTKIAEFNIVGHSQLPAYRALFAELGPRLQATADAEVNAQYQAAVSNVGVLQRAWVALDEKVNAAIVQLRSFGLGNVLLFALGAALVAVAGGMWLFFLHAQGVQADVNRLVASSVAAGKMTPAEGAQWMRGEGFGASLGSFGSKLLVIAAIGAAVYFIPRRASS